MAAVCIQPDQSTIDRRAVLVDLKISADEHAPVRVDRRDSLRDGAEPVIKGRIDRPVRVQAQRSIQVELLDSLASLVQARTNLAQALYEHSIAMTRLYRAAGRN